MLALLSLFFLGITFGPIVVPFATTATGSSGDGLYFVNIASEPRTAIWPDEEGNELTGDEVGYHHIEPEQALCGKVLRNDGLAEGESWVQLPPAKHHCCFIMRFSNTGQVNLIPKRGDRFREFTEFDCARSNGNSSYFATLCSPADGEWEVVGVNAQALFAYNQCTFDLQQ